MKRRFMVGWAGLAMAILLSGCTVPRAIVFEAEGFEGKLIREGDTAFLLPAEIDIKPCIQDFVAAFDGNPAAGEAMLREVLQMCLTGEEPLMLHSRASRQRLKLRDAESFHTGGWEEWFSVEQDKYGLSTLQMKDAAALEAALTQEGLRYLIVFQDLVVTRDVKSTSGSMISTGTGSMMYAPGGTSQVPTLYGQMHILSATGPALLWHGYIKGANSVSFRFSEGTVRGLAAAFAADVLDALN